MGHVCFTACKNTSGVIKNSNDNANSSPKDGRPILHRYALIFVIFSYAALAVAFKEFYTHLYNIYFNTCVILFGQVIFIPVELVMEGMYVRAHLCVKCIC